jgi:hypothetical protein
MVDRVVIPLPGMGTLELPRDVFEQHLVRPAARITLEDPRTELVDAVQLERRTGVPASWWMSQARERRVPFRKLGRYVRFDLAEVMNCDAYRRRALDSAGGVQHDAEVAERRRQSSAAPVGNGSLREGVKLLTE